MSYMLPGLIEEQNGFSPRNGEAIIKAFTYQLLLTLLARFSPHNGEAILKVILPVQNQHLHCFSPHNGEVILKEESANMIKTSKSFPSPQWGDSSKGKQLYRAKKLLGFRPRNGGVILKESNSLDGLNVQGFQSPQWGDSYKGRENE